MELAGAARALPRFRKKSAAVLQPDLRRNATRCKHIIAESGENYKRKFQETFRKQFADKRKGQEKHRGSAAGSFEFSAFFVKGRRTFSAGKKGRASCTAGALQIGKTQVQRCGPGKPRRKRKIPAAAVVTGLSCNDSFK